MKRLITVILLVLILSLTGCSDKEKTDVSGDDKDIISEDSAGDNIEKDSTSEDNKFDKKENDDNSADKELSEYLITTDSQISTSNNEATVTGKSDGKQNVKDDIRLSEYGELAKKLALQMSKGEYKETHDTLSPLAKLRLTLKALEQGYKDTVADMGEFIRLREVTEEAVGNGRIVYVVLDYDNSGVRILFQFNTDKKIEYLRTGFAPYDIEPLDASIEELAISLGDRNNPNEGILTLPRNVKNPPVAILVHGSGTHDADETIGVNKPFRDLAHGLAKMGIAVIRYKEIIPKSTDKYTIEDDCLAAASHAIQYAQGCGKVDTEKIIIIGHSLGGMMAAKIAYDNKEVDGIVSLAGSPRRLEDIVLDQVRILNKANESINEAMYKISLIQTEAEVNKIKALKEGGSETILGAPASYWYSLNQIDTPSIVRELDIPIFIAQGSEDFQVYADIDYIAWKELLKDRDNATFRLYDKLNHLFMTANGRMDTTEYNIRGTMEQTVIDDIANWILKIN